MDLYKLLLVDDNARSLKLLNAIFESEGYATVTACDGREAFEILLQQKIDLVITDILMPNVDGYYLCYKIRTNDSLKNIPIIVYSGTFTSAGEEKVAREMGADLFIRKPAVREVLLTAVKDILAHPGNYPKADLGRQMSFEVFHQYSAELIEKLEQRNNALEETKVKLERTVAERTRSLDMANEELSASNEELRAANEELTAMNDQLTLASQRIKEQSEIIIRQQEEALKRSEQNLDIIFSNTQEEILVLDHQGKILFFNHALEKFIMQATGKIPEVGMYLWNMTVPARISIARSLFRRAMLGEQIEVEAPIRLGDREVIHLLRYSPVFIEHKITYVTIISTDITEKKKQEDRLRQSEANLGAIFNNTVDSFLLLDADLKILAFNENNVRLAREFTGMELEAGKNLLSMLLEDRRKNLEFLIEKVNKGEAVNYTSHNGSGDSEKWYDVSIAPVRDKKNCIIGYCITSHDTTERVRAIAEIEKNVKELTDYRNNLEKRVDERTRALNMALNKEKELVQMKNQFVSIASHEFRTPLTSIAIASGFIKKYKAKLSPEEIDEKMMNIEKQVTNMTYLLDDILMIGKAEAGKLPVLKKETNIVSFFENITREVEKTTGATHTVRLFRRLAADTIVVDEKLLRNIVINLLTNAIKFSPDADTVDVTITSEPGCFFINVKDYGMGIPENDIRNLFEPFFRGGNATSIQGTGLGLSIIKKAVDLLSGSVGVKSVLGKGTEFQVELPL